MVSLARKKLVISSTGNAGLRIITQISEGQSNVVLKSGLKHLTSSTPSLSSSVISSNNFSDANGDYCFLSSCYLCNKSLSPDKDVYMYRGEHGFCSEECRSRQIKVDEANEMEAKIKNRLKAYTPLDCRGCETCRLLEDVRQQRHRRNYNKLSTTEPQPLLSISS